MKKYLEIKILITFILIQAISGLAGGIGLISDPTGASLRIPQEWLTNSPFKDYLIPGIILFTVLGIFPAIVSIGLWKEKYWGWLGSLLLGFALLIWIIVEIIIIGYQSNPPLQLIYGILGIVILLLTNLPRVKKFYLIEK
jgi:peptidoglycan/LPS O-acetylase OafA/YrhL